MKKYLLTSVVVFMSSAAIAADKKTFNLTPNEMFAISNGLSLLDGYHRIVKDARGQDIDVIVPFDMNNSVRLTIAHDETILRNMIEDLHTSVKGLDKDKANEVADTKEPVELLTIDIKDLRVESNPYPATALSLIHDLTDDPAKP